VKCTQSSAQIDARADRYCRKCGLRVTPSEAGIVVPPVSLNRLKSQLFTAISFLLMVAGTGMMLWTFGFL
jgi:hypothetical protein